MNFEFSQKKIDLLLHIDKHGFVTKTSRPFLSSLRFYNYIWMLRDENLVVVDGTDESHQKRWILSNRGKKIVGHIKSINEVFKNEG
jgi:predicted transcriptional regulator